MKVTFGKAISDALNEEMRRDSKVIIYGEDVAEFGNIFGLTRGMLEEYGPKPKQGKLLMLDKKLTYLIQKCDEESGVYRMTRERTRQG